MTGYYGNHSIDRGANVKIKYHEIKNSTYPSGFFVEFDTSDTVEAVQVEPSPPFGANSVQNETRLDVDLVIEYKSFRAHSFLYISNGHFGFVSNRKISKNDLEKYKNSFPPARAPKKFKETKEKEDGNVILSAVIYKYQYTASLCVCKEGEEEGNEGSEWRSLPETDIVNAIVSSSSVLYLLRYTTRTKPRLFLIDKNDLSTRQLTRTNYQRGHVLYAMSKRDGPSLSSRLLPVLHPSPFCFIFGIFIYFLSFYSSSTLTKQPTNTNTKSDVY